MCKQISIILVCIISLVTMTGCGIKGPLYQTPLEKVDPNPPEKTEMSQQ